MFQRSIHDSLCFLREAISVKREAMYYLFTLRSSLSTRYIASGFAKAAAKVRKIHNS